MISPLGVATGSGATSPTTPTPATKTAKSAASPQGEIAGDRNRAYKGEVCLRRLKEADDHNQEKFDRKYSKNLHPSPQQRTLFS